MEKGVFDLDAEVSVLNQLVLSLEQNIGRLKDAYEKKNREDFVKIKKLILKTQKEINELLR